MTDEEKTVLNNYKNDNSYLEQIESFLKGKLNKSYSIKVGNTSNSMKIVGAKNLDLIINQSVLQNSINDESIKMKKHSSGHNISIDFIKQLPNEIRNPTMIFKSKNNCIVLLSTSKDSNDRNIIIPIELNSQGYANKVNKITSIYGRNNIALYIERQINSGNLLAYNKNKADKLLYQIGQQLPNDEKFISFNDSIAYSMKSVKFPTEKNKERINKMNTEQKIDESIEFIEEIKNGRLIGNNKVRDSPEENSAQIEQNYEKDIESKEITKNEENTPQKYSKQILKEETYEYNFDEEIKTKYKDINLLNALSEEGDLLATNMLAVAFYFGDNTKPDIDKAVELFELSADKGNAAAQRNLAIIFENNEPRDQEKAVKYYEMAANNENPDPYAINNLGVCYLMGEGVKTNIKKAVSLFEKAIKMGDDYAKLNLADCLTMGNGMKINEEKSFELYWEIARNKEDKKISSKALIRLSECYLQGKGTKINPQFALECLKTASETGNEKAKLLYKNLKKKLTPTKHVDISNKTAEIIKQNIINNEKTSKEKEMNNKEKSENQKKSKSKEHKKTHQQVM